MSELTEEKLEGFRNILENKLHEAQQKREEIQVQLRGYQESAPDPMDQASKIEARNDMLAQSRYFESTIRQIAKTLNNFEDYGYCLTCGDEIDIKRLEAQPASTECVFCKEMQEHKSKGIRH